MADRLEREAARNLPDRWGVGMRVRYLRSSAYGWDAGDEGTVIGLGADCQSKKGGEYQVFYTRPDKYEGSFWTTPDDVELID